MKVFENTNRTVVLGLVLIALGLMFNWQRGIRSDIQDVRSEVQNVRADVSDMRSDMQTLSERVARIEGYMNR